MNAKPPKPERITPPEAASLLSGLDMAVEEVPGSSTGVGCDVGSHGRTAGNLVNIKDFARVGTSLKYIVLINAFFGELVRERISSHKNSKACRL
jgi:hypothetical protein